MKISGIYKIESKVHPERCYIGSAVDIKNRWYTHLSNLNKEKHHSSKLQRNYNKYGKQDLTFSIIAICDKSELKPINGVIWVEQFFMDVYKPFFNNAPTAGSNFGVVQSQETINKRISKLKGRTMPKGFGENISARMMGNTHGKGHFCSLENWKKAKERSTGHKFSEESINIMRTSHLGKKQTSDQQLRKLESKLLGLYIRELEGELGA